MVFASVKVNDGFTIEKPNILRPSLKMTILQPLLTISTEATGHNIKWDHFVLAKGKIKETLFIQELEPAFNVNVGSEKLMLYLFNLFCFYFYLYRGYYTGARRYEFYFRVAKQYFTNERSE